MWVIYFCYEGFTGKCEIRIIACMIREEKSLSHDGARKPRSVIQNAGNLFLLGGVYQQV